MSRPLSGATMTWWARIPRWETAGPSNESSQPQSTARRLPGADEHGRAQYGSPIQAAMRLAETYFDGKPITLKANKKRLSNETATCTFNTLVTAQKILALRIESVSSSAGTRKTNCGTCAQGLCRIT
jgi:hypothetical protein